MKIEYGSKAPRCGTLEKRSPLVLVHGLWGDKSQWNGWLDEFPGREVQAMDLYGHGEIERNLDKVPLSRYVDHVCFKLREAKEPVYLVGHSAGGVACATAAAANPGKVKHLFLLASSPNKESGVKIPPNWNMARPSVAWALASGNSFEMPEGLQKKLGGGQPIRFGRESGLALRQVIRSACSVPPLSCGVTVIAAENDEFMSLRIQQAIARYHDGRMDVLPGNHMFHWHPAYRERVISTVRQIISSIEMLSPRSLAA